MHRLGARRLVAVGVLPLGCVPLTKTFMNQKSCVRSLNNVAYSFNAKLIKQLTNLKAKLGLQIVYVDVYGMIHRAVMSPELYG